MSRKQVGDAIGIAAVTLGQWERGNFTRPPAQGMLSMIAKATRIPAALEFVTESPARPSVAERARAAAQRLGDTPGASPESDDAQGAAGGEE
jgi:transcriptional regulator with XRE-family HTH domain